MTDNASAKRAAPRQYSPEFKRQVVEQSFAGHETVTAVARAHGITDSMMWRWRKQYKAKEPVAGAVQGVNFLPVGVKVPLTTKPSVDSSVDAQAHDRLELHLDSARVVIYGRADRETLAAVIEVLK